MTASSVTADGVKWDSPLTLYGRAFSRLFFPEVCPLCAKDLQTWERAICGTCAPLFCELREPLCGRCAKELPVFSGLTLCGECRQGRHPVDRTWALFTYNDAFKRILHLVKFCGKPALLRIFDSSIHSFIQKTDWPALDMMIPVPLDRIRQWERGFNQSALLALQLEKSLGIPVEPRILKKKITAAPQSRLHKAERFMNIRENFKVKTAGKIAGRNILLVDDVYTTGATASECARTLKAAGAHSVYVFTLAKAQLNLS